MKKLNSFLNFLIFTLVVIIGGVFFYFKNHKETKRAAGKPADLSSQELDLIVNKYIKTTNLEAFKSKVMAEKFILEARQRLAELDKQKRLKQDKENAELPKERQIRKDNESFDPGTPIVNSRVTEKNDQEVMNEQEKKEYAKQWILNARKAGYLLELSPDLEVIRYTPIRKPSQQDDSAESYPSD